MIEELLEKAKNDKRVTLDFVINNKIHAFKATNDNNKKLLLYIHGLGSNKNWITRFYNELLDNNYNVYSIDQVSHGNDDTPFNNFNLTNCISYLKETINYIKENHKDSEIYVLGSSYGGFVILNAYKDIINDVKKIYLMCPAVNFTDIMEEKIENLNINYFDNNEYLPLYNDIKIYKDAYIEFKKGNEYVKNEKYNNISIIQGDIDKTVNVDKIKEFCNKNNLDLKIIKDGKHELYGYDKEIIDFIMK